MPPDLLDFVKRVSKDQKALNSVTLSRSSATYITSHGVAHDIKEKLSNALSTSFFSLNIDEATNNAKDKVLNVMVQYFDEQKEQCVVQLLGAKPSNISTSANITDVVCELLEERGLNNEQIVSCLMDNCNVMRGKKSGVETRLRQKNPHLLDVSGDTVHTINNAAKKFFGEIEQFLPFESFCNDLFYDIEESPKVRELFSVIQLELYGTKKCVLRPIPNRFNQMLAVASRVSEIWDALRVYYSCFFSPKDAHKYGKEVGEILSSHQLSPESREMIHALLVKQKSQAKSSTSSDRKDRILNLLFDKCDQTLLIMNLYQGILAKFEVYIKMFQSSKPMAHQLHAELFNIIKDFYSFFIKPEIIPLHNAKELDQLDVSDESAHLSKSNLFVGDKAKPLLLVMSKDRQRNGQWLNSFFTALKKGYIACSTGLKKLPLTNSTLIELSHLGPGFQRSSTTGPALMNLAKKMPNVISSDQIGVLDAEIKAYTVDEGISLIDVDEDDASFRIDVSWWAKIFKMKVKGCVKYPTLGKLVKALLSVFSGPLVEASFNIMDDILESDRSRMTNFNYEALAMIKSYFIATGQTTTSIQITPSMRSAVASSFSRFNEHKSLSTKPASNTSYNAPLSTIASSKSNAPLPTSVASSNAPISSNTPSKSNAPLSTASGCSTSKKRKQQDIGSFFLKKPKLLINRLKRL